MKKESGFTLLELMVTVAVATILMSIAVPAFRDMIQNTRLTNAANTFAASVNLARSRAAKQGTPVYITAVGGNWDNGWRVWSDTTSAVPNQVYDSGTDEVLRTETLESRITLASGTLQFRFSPSGRVDGADTLKLCDDSRNNETGRLITINSIGRLSISRDANACP